MFLNSKSLSNSLNTKLIKNLVNILSALCLLFISMDVFKSIIFVTQQSLWVSNIDINYDYNNLLEILSAIFKSHTFLISLAILLSISMLFKRKIGLYYFSFITFCSFYFPIYQWLDDYVHPFFFKIHLYDIFIRQGQSIINPQYTKVLLLFLSIIFLFILCLFKKYRTTDRVFICLISSVVFVTLLVFHIAIPIGFYKYERFEQTQNLEKVSLEQEANKVCKNRMCLYLDKDFVSLPNQKAKASTIENFQNYRFFLNIAKNYFIKNTDKNVFGQTLGNFQGQQFDYTVSVIVKNFSGYLWILDDNVLKKASRLSEIYFSFLCVIAHYIWIFGGMMLLFIHKKILFKRKNRVIITQTNIKDNSNESINE